MPLPSIKDVVDALDDLCESLMGTLQDIVDISSELAHRDHVRIDNIEEVSDLFEAQFQRGSCARKTVGGDSEALRRLDATQRRSLVCRVLERDVIEKRRGAEANMSMFRVFHPSCSAIPNLYFASKHRNASASPFSPHKLLHIQPHIVINP